MVRVSCRRLCPRAAGRGHTFGRRGRLSCGIDGVRRQAGPSKGPSTVAVLDQAFGRHERLALGRYNPSFAAAWERLGSQLADWQRMYGLRDPAGTATAPDGSY